MAAAHGKPSIFPEALIRDIQKAATAGTAKLNEYLKENSNKWKLIPINIGITGESGVGKSSFINAMRGISADDEGGAHVDVVEATKECTPYKHPDNELMIFWDLPGVGTPNFPRDNYLDTVEFKKFDFFLILSAGRFREDDVWLAKKIRELNRNFYFIRTKIDSDITNDEKDHPKTHSREAVIERIREDCKQNLEARDIKEAAVFLIDNHCKTGFDFNHLATSLIDNVPENKMEALTYSISVLTDGVLEKKVEAIGKRIYMISILSAFSGAVPLPVLGAVFDAALISTEVSFYKKQLGLDEKTMQENARLLSSDERNLQKKLGLKSFVLGADTKTVVQSFSSLALDEAVESTLPFAFPIIGSLVSAGVSYGYTVYCLTSFLKLFYSDAKKIQDEIMKTVFKKD